MSNAFLDSFEGMEYTTTQAMQAFAPVAGTFELIQGHALTASQAVSMMNVAMQLAEATGDTLTQATSDLSSVLIATGGKAQDAGKDMNVLFNMSRLTGVAADQLSTMINRLAPSLAGTGVSFSQVGGIMVDFVKNFGVGRKTVTEAGTAIRDLAHPTADSALMMQTLGIKTTDTSGKFVGFAQALRNYKVGLDENYTAAQRAALITDVYGATATTQEENVSNATLRSAVAQKFFGSSLGPVMAVLMSNTKQLGEYGKAANKSGVLSAAASDQLNTLRGRMEVLHASVHDATTAIGAALAPAVEKLARLVVPLIERLAEWTEKHKTLAATILGSMFVFGVLTAAVAALSLVLMTVSGPVALIVGGLVLIGIAAGAIAMAVLAPQMLEKALEKLGVSAKTAARVTRDLQQAWEDFKVAAEAIWAELKPIIEAYLKQIEAAMQLFGDLIHGRWSKIWGDILHLLEADLKLIIAVFKPSVTLMVDAGKALMEGLLHGIESMAGAVINKAKQVGHDLVSAAKSVWGIWHTVKTWVGDFEGMILQFFNGADRWLEGVGESIIQGFWNGMKSVWSGVESWFHNTVESMISTFKSALDIGAPSGVFQEIGENIMAGLQIGTQQTTPGATSTIASAASSMAHGVMPIAGSYGGGGSGGGITVVINNPTISNQNDIARMTSQISSQLARFVIRSSGLRLVQR